MRERSVPKEELKSVLFGADVRESSAVLTENKVDDGPGARRHRT